MSELSRWCLPGNRTGFGRQSLVQNREVFVSHVESHNLEDAIRLDQLYAVRKTVSISIPVNIVLGIAAVVIAINSGRTTTGLGWFFVSSLVNVFRFGFCRYPINTDNAGRARLPQLSVNQHLVMHAVFALASGIVWASIPILSDGYTTPESLFYLILGCGITAGAVTYGYSFAPIAISFITPPILSAVGCFIWAGGLERNLLAATMVLYLAALVRGAIVGQRLVRSDSRLKHEATLLSRSLEVANANAISFASLMQQRAVHDQLTGLLNRRGFSEALELYVPGNERVCLMLLDLDGFKSVNDAFGHKAGDRVLIEVARRLRATVPDDILVARLGGDEFAILYDDRSVEEEPEILATRLIAAISIPFSQLDAGRVGVSIGIYQGRTQDIDEMLIYADTALYSAKKEGRNRFRMFDEELRRQALIRRDIERDLATALAKEEPEIWFQPIMRDGGRKLDTLEALLRWNHPEHDWIDPMEIVGTAATSGLSETLTRFVLREVINMIRVLKALGMTDVRVAMNVSPREMAQIAIDELVLRKLKEKGAPASMLELEMTEEVAVNPRAVQEKLARLKAAGVSLAIDDFGSGYSSLGLLQQFHVHRVKIDKSFIAGVAGSEKDRSLVGAVLGVSRAFGFDVVAEGVEREEDVEALRELGCSLLQGYYFAKPMSFEQAVNWAKRHHVGKRNGAAPET